MSTLTTSDPKPNDQTVPEPVEHLRDESDLTLSVRHLVVEHGRGKNRIQAVADVSFDIRQGETLGLVGESGCGKSSLAHAVMQLPRPTSGSVLLQDRELVGLSGRQLSEARAPLQMILQDPMSSINPMRRIRDVVVEGLAMRGVSAQQRGAAAAAALDEVGLDIDVVGNRRANELSGGQCQRVCIARCLVLEPTVIICDEPVSALDVSVQAQTLNLLQDMKRRHGVSILFIAHDLAVVRNISDRVAVMYLGKICELGPADDVYDRPLHPYSLALLDAIPVPDPSISTPRAVLRGEPPSAMDPPSGCRFSPRCPSADHLCRSDEPRLRELEPGHYVACHHPNELTEIQLRWPTADRAGADPTPTPTPTDPGVLAGESLSSLDRQSPASTTESGEDNDG